MMTETYKPRIFISYAHADEPEKPANGGTKWLSFVERYLRPALKQGAAEIWIDRLTRGDDWNSEVERKLRDSDIFILLVSSHLLSATYPVDKEIAIMRERHERGEDVHFYPLLLTPMPRSMFDLVRDWNLRPENSRPLSSYSIHDRERRMSEVADEITAIARAIAVQKSKQLPAVLSWLRERVPPAETPAADLGSEIEDQDSPGHKTTIDLALARARERGSTRAADVLARNDMLSSNQMARLLGTTRMTINTKRRKHQLLGLEGARRGFRFPQWQINNDGQPFDALPDLFDRLGGSPWAVYRFLVQHHPELGGLSGREALAKGRSAEAIQAAESVAEAFS
jgi:hypothetical protein